MDKCKELFHLLSESQYSALPGKVSVHQLAVDLAAGGVTTDHIKYVRINE